MNGSIAMFVGIATTALALFPEFALTQSAVLETPICLSSSSDPDGDGWGWENDASCVIPATNPQCEDRGTFPWGWDPVTLSSCRLDGEVSQRECVDSPPLNDGWGWNGIESCQLTAADTCEDHGTYPWGWNPATLASCRLDETPVEGLAAQIQSQQTIWNSYGYIFGSYEYRYSVAVSGSDAGCPTSDIAPPLFITVTNDMVSAVSNGVSSYPVDNFRTIDQILEDVLNTVDSVTRAPSYSMSFGYPKSYTLSNPIEGCPSWETDYNIDLCGDGITCNTNDSQVFSPNQCLVEGGNIVGDPGDGQTSQPGYRCTTTGLPIRGIIIYPIDGPIPIEGAVCC